MSSQVNLKSVRFFLIAVLFLIAVASLLHQPVTGYFFEREAVRADSSLRLITASLRGALDRFRALPKLISSNKSIGAHFDQAIRERKSDALNEQLFQINKTIGSSDLYLMDHTGLTIGASNYQSDASFLGRNFNYRPYFTQAIEGENSEYFALGTTSLKRGYYFSSPIVRQSKISGVAVLKVDIGTIESSWVGVDHEVLVVDNYGVIFMSSRKEWHYKTLGVLSNTRLLEIKNSRRYGLKKITSLDISGSNDADDLHPIMRIVEGGSSQNYLVHQNDMLNANWTVYVLSNTSAALTQIYTSMAVAILISLIAIILFALAIQRRERLLANIEYQKRTQEILEVKVSERTADLDLLNRKLRTEVKERKLTEKELRKTQEDLIQAGKLAALGQMSAAISHEFNQPLGAIRSYADNACAYLNRGQDDKASDNMSRISLLVERMATISKHLRNFARKPEENTSSIDLQEVVTDVFEMEKHHLIESKIHSNIVFPNKSVTVVGGQIRLQHVFINLLNNALDAVESVDKPEIILSVYEDEKFGYFSIEDNGHGIEFQNLDTLFDPFFTTKGIGKGLGLGLSISYNIVRDFGGTIKVENRAEVGAKFTVVLKKAKQAKTVEKQKAIVL